MHEIIQGSPTVVGTSLLEFVYSGSHEDSNLSQRLKDDRDCAQFVLSEGWCRCELCGKRVSLKGANGRRLSIYEWLVHKVKCKSTQ